MELNHQYESTIRMTRNAMHAEIDDNALMYPSSFLHLKETLPLPHAYENARNVLQVDKDAEAMVSSTKGARDRIYGIATPTEPTDKMDENDFTY